MQLTDHMPLYKMHRYIVEFSQKSFNILAHIGLAMDILCRDKICTFGFPLGSIPKGPGALLEHFPKGIFELLDGAWTVALTLASCFQLCCVTGQLPRNSLLNIMGNEEEAGIIHGPFRLRRMFAFCILEGYLLFAFFGRMFAFLGSSLE